MILGDFSTVVLLISELRTWDINDGSLRLTYIAQSIYCSNTKSVGNKGDRMLSGSLSYDFLGHQLLRKTPSGSGKRICIYLWLCMKKLSIGLLNPLINAVQVSVLISV